MLARQVVVATLLSVAALGPLVSGCSSDVTSDDASGTIDGAENEVKVDTRTPEARRQYDANVDFATSYTPRCVPTGSDRPRVLLTGFGRFMTIGNNATGRIISTLVPAVHYPETSAPTDGGVDLPGPQLSVATSTIDLPGAGLVDVCAMILPVYWDLAAILIAKEMDHFKPTFVMMNGVAGDRQPLWIELGATNRAAPLDDGSNQLRPALRADEQFAKIVDNASSSENARANLLSWAAVKTAAAIAVSRHASDVDQGTRFDELLPGVRLAGFPRPSNTYLCNNVTYVTGYLMSHPRANVRLMKASPAVRGKVNEVKVQVQTDLRAVPRVFVHWPAEMASMHHAAGADVMKAILGAQLTAMAHGEAPTNGDNTLADPSLPGGDFF